tara:strand:+ start:282 stop:458 length:177 start_codon:yes stop_codon:yes gene_type:complete
MEIYYPFRKLRIQLKTDLVILGSLFLFFTAVLPIHAKTTEQWKVNVGKSCLGTGENNL